MKIRIMADSTCDLSPEYIAEHGIIMLPLQVNLGGRDYRDGVDITPDDIFRAVAEGADLPKTSAINVEEYRKAFKKGLEGCDALIQCTPIGMKEDGDYMFDLSEIGPGTAVMDMVYNRKTALVSAAEKKGCTVVSGIDMLVGQGAASFRRWFGKDADIQAMERAAQ